METVYIYPKEGDSVWYTISEAPLALPIPLSRLSPYSEPVGRFIVKAIKLNYRVIYLKGADIV